MQVEAKSEELLNLNNIWVLKSSIITLLLISSKSWLNMMNYTYQAIVEFLDSIAPLCSSEVAKRFRQHQYYQDNAANAM